MSHLIAIGSRKLLVLLLILIGFAGCTHRVSVEQYPMKEGMVTSSLGEGPVNVINAQDSVGEELIGYAPYTGQTPTREYHEEHDYALFQGQPDFIHMQQGMFAIFFPTDLHMPGMGKAVSPVRKVVVKVAV